MSQATVSILGARSSSSSLWDLSRREDQIYQAAVCHFAEKGFHGTNLRQISATVGMEAGSLYYYVPGKAELLRIVMMRCLEALLSMVEEALAQAKGAPPLGRLEVALRAHILCHIRYPAEAKVVDSELSSLLPEHREAVVALRDRYEGIFRGLVVEAVQQGQLPPLPPEHIKAAVAAMLTAGTATSYWFNQEGPLSAEAVADIFCRLFRNGLVGLGAMNASGDPHRE